MNNDVSQAKKIKPVIHLPRYKTQWYKTQYWSGFIFGLCIGLLTGLPFAFVVYQIAKVVVHFIEGV